MNKLSQKTIVMLKNWTKLAWETVSPQFDQITKMNFIQELSSGELPNEKFLFYLFQDSIYLEEYGRILAIISGKLKSTNSRSAFLKFAFDTIFVEKELHKSYFEELNLAKNQFEISPSCMLYTSYLHKLISIEPIEVAVAGILPCFVVYKEVGDYILKNYNADNNPYQEWIDTYGGEDFANAVQKAVAICNEVAEQTTDEIREKMLEAYVYSTKMEYLFWNSAYKLEKWEL